MKKEICVVSVLVCILLVSGCIGQDQSNATNNTVSTLQNNTGYITSGNMSDVQKIEIIHFHGTHQCYSCITVGAYAEETVNTYFSEEVKNGKISFAHINGDLPENREIVTKYGVTGSSLWIGVYDENGFHKEENINVWYKIDNKERYMTYLKGLIDKRLNGDMQ